MYGITTSSAIGAQLQRSPNSIRVKAAKLGLKSNLSRNGTNLNEIIEMIELGYHPTEIASNLNKSTKNIYNTVRDRLGGTLYRSLKLNAKRRGRMTPRY